jgi:predicted acylesterase/phospholipase RssA
MLRRHVLRGIAGGGVMAAAAGCSAPARLASLPERLRPQATFAGLPADARFVLDGSDDARMGQFAVAATRREVMYAMRGGDLKELGPADFLAISGGGENGAFGAGLLTAWTELGTRPTFKAVSGVSTGALIAPLAFLGPQYDKELERFYTRITAADVMTSRGLIRGVLGDSMADSAPLLRTIRGVLTPEVVAAIGREYSEKGRLLLIATTNLDVPVGVLWNIGGIAASGNPRAGELIAEILLASASVPGVFPPVMIDVEAGGERFHEMHVDGGTVAQVVLYPPSFNAAEVLANTAPEVVRLRNMVLNRKRRLFIIRNSRPGADLQTVDRSTLKIAGRAVSTLISTQGIGDLYQLYLIAQRDGMEYNVAVIPATFQEKLEEPFEQAYMRKLFQVGREVMLNGTAWSKVPPGYNPRPFSPQHVPIASRS